METRLNLEGEEVEKERVVVLFEYLLMLVVAHTCCCSCFVSSSLDCWFLSLSYLLQISVRRSNNKNKRIKLYEITDIHSSKLLQIKKIKINNWHSFNFPHWWHNYNSKLYLTQFTSIKLKESSSWVVYCSSLGSLMCKNLTPKKKPNFLRKKQRNSFYSIQTKFSK